ncbi:MAG: cytochrome c oxidase assembly protein, partial [Proteobacteria bacterium]|nr:cytochrome c oxidase assembly protein [Pseudomonadota bacterium]
MSSSNPSDPKAKRRFSRNAQIALICGVVFVGMVGAAFAAVPFYRAFCQATGYGGTVRKAEAQPDKVLDQTVDVSFDTNVRGLPWDFKAETPTQTVKIGETAVATFKVTNHADHPITARAVFNVTPDQAGTYFRKLQCFCFSDQTVPAGATVEMPVLYFVDPQYAQDINTRNGRSLTLSYTFFPATDVKAGAEKAATEKPGSG